MTYPKTEHTPGGGNAPPEDRGDPGGEALLERAAHEQAEVLGFTFTPQADRPLTVLGLMPWRELWSMGWGAGATAFLRAPVALAAAGHHVHVVHPGAASDEREATLGGVRFHRYRAPAVFSDPSLPLPARLWSRLWRYAAHQWIAPAKAMPIARRINPDVVIAYDVITAPGARRLADRLKRPLIGRYFGNTLSLALGNRWRWYGNFIERVGFRVPVEAMVLTNDGSPILEVFKRLRIDPGPIHFLRNGIPADVFTPGPRPRGLLASLGLPEDAFVLMTVTRLHSEKRLDRTLRALALLRREVPAAVAILLGDGPERESLQRTAQDLGIAAAVRMPGPVRNVDLPAWYRLADVVLSLLDRTNASNPVFESMACERCVMALDVGTTAEVVRHEETGILVSLEAPQREQELIERLAAVLGELARDPGRRAAIGRRARPHVLGLCGTVEQRMKREVEIVEAVARGERIVPRGAGVR